MAKTPYKDLKSTDVLSGHLSGIQHDINKIQEVLNMQVSDVSGHRLNPVIDQDDPSLRYRIYEGSIRNWLENPAPVIYRNGVEVDPSEYILQSPYGVVIFETQQNANDAITADFSYINSDSRMISDINNAIDSNINSISDLSADVQGMKNDITNLESQIQSFDYQPLDPTRRKEIINVYPQYSADDLPIATDVLHAGDTIDCFPIIIDERITIKQLMVKISGSNPEMTMNLGIYSNADAYPHELLGETGNFTTVAGMDMYMNLENSVVLDKGIYWLARYQNGGAYLHGHEVNENINIIIKNTSDFAVNGSGIVIGTRSLSGAADVINNGLPSIYPPNGDGSEYLSRPFYGTVFAIR